MGYYDAMNVSCGWVCPTNTSINLPLDDKPLDEEFIVYPSHTWVVYHAMHREAFILVPVGNQWVVTVLDVDSADEYAAGDEEEDPDAEGHYANR